MTIPEILRELEARTGRFPRAAVEAAIETIPAGQVHLDGLTLIEEAR
jgi:hypothetical protein